MWATRQLTEGFLGSLHRDIPMEPDTEISGCQGDAQAIPNDCRIENRSDGETSAIKCRSSIGSSSRPSEEVKRRRFSSIMESFLKRPSIRQIPDPRNPVNFKLPELKPHTIQWPKMTVSHMMRSLGTKENVMKHYRTLGLADHLNDEDLCCFLEEQLCKEKAGLSETYLAILLKARKHVSSAVNHSDSCSICMADYKEGDKIASLYYCPHEYHAHCIKEWLLKTNLCPMCRALAIIPQEYPSWGGDVQLHQAFFVLCTLQSTT